MAKAIAVGMDMDRSTDSFSPLAQHPNLFVRQTKKGCIQEMFGCEAETEFKISTMEAKDQVLYYAIEKSSCCIRFCCPMLRPFDMTVSHGSSAGGELIANYHRDFACPASACKCCCYQSIQVSDAKGAPAGSVKEDCYYCGVPSFSVLRPDESLEYTIHMPTCCFGLCVNCCKEGCCNCRVPFYIYPPGAKEGEEVGKVVKIWSGLTKELFTDADNFEVEFPAAAEPSTKSRLLGGLFLLNQLYFETSSNNA